MRPSQVRLLDFLVSCVCECVCEWMYVCIVCVCVFFCVCKWMYVCIVCVCVCVCVCGRRHISAAVSAHVTSQKCASPRQARPPGWIRVQCGPTAILPATWPHSTNLLGNQTSCVVNYFVGRQRTNEQTKMKSTWSQHFFSFSVFVEIRKYFYSYRSTNEQTKMKSTWSRHFFSFLVFVEIRKYFYSYRSTDNSLQL